jgi:hypothetical protein
LRTVLTSNKKALFNHATRIINKKVILAACKLAIEQRNFVVEHAPARLCNHTLASSYG